MSNPDKRDNNTLSKDFSIEGVFFLWAFAVVLEQSQMPREKDTLY